MGRRTKVLGAILCMTVAGVFLYAGNRGVPASNGIANFGKVNDSLFRGAQPDEAGIRNLKTLGVKIIINLREPKEVVASEAEAARANGIAYTNIPFAGIGRPTDADITQVLAIIASSGPVFVHCAHGCDRTGTVIACYRIQHDHWSGDDALSEAAKYGLSRLERGMRHYIADFADNARKSAALSPAKP